MALERKKLVDRLISLIVRYNQHYYYSVLKRNCQHFVKDALEAMEVELPEEFVVGRLGEYYDALVKGKTPSVPSFKSHSDLDEYVLSKQSRNAMVDMPQHDLEFILALYFRFHMEAQSRLRKNQAALENWQCREVGCCMQEVLRLINLESMKIYTLHNHS